MRVPDYAEPLRAYRVWVVSIHVRRDDFLEADHGRVPFAVAVPGLRAHNTELYWRPGRNQAECLIENHRAPDFGCSCGLYASRELRSLFSGLVKTRGVTEHSAAVEFKPRVRQAYANPGDDDSVDEVFIVEVTVPGVVELWGRIIEHEHGWRAEYARPLALLDASKWGVGIHHLSGAFEVMAALYGMHLIAVPVVLEELAERIIDPPRLEPNPDVRVLTGGALHGKVVSAPGQLERLDFPATQWLNVSEEAPLVSAPRLVYTRSGPVTYRFKEEA